MSYFNTFIIYICYCEIYRIIIFGILSCNILINLQNALVQIIQFTTLGKTLNERFVNTHALLLKDERLNKLYFMTIFKQIFTYFFSSGYLNFSQYEIFCSEQFFPEFNIIFLFINFFYCPLLFSLQMSQIVKC